MFGSFKMWYERNRIQPIRAGVAMYRLLQDPNDTPQVFKVVEALRGNSLEQTVGKMRADERGRELLRKRPRIMRALSNRDLLAALPEGRLGRAYFNATDGSVIIPDALITSSKTARQSIKLNRDERWLGMRNRDIHDLQHVITGYGNDPLGELCLLAFITTQTPSRGVDAIVFMARLKAQRDNPTLDYATLIEEAQSIAKRADWMLYTCWEDRLAEPLDRIREELGFQPPVHYYDALQHVRELESSAAESH